MQPLLDIHLLWIRKAVNSRRLYGGILVGPDEPDHTGIFEMDGEVGR